jgi:hypothetical protein
MMVQGDVPVIPRETDPRATNRGISAAGRNTLCHQRSADEQALVREEDVQRDRVILHERDVEPVLSIKLDICAGKELDAFLVEAAWGGKSDQLGVRGKAGMRCGEELKSVTGDTREDVVRSRKSNAVNDECNAIVHPDVFPTPALSFCTKGARSKEQFPHRSGRNSRSAREILARLVNRSLASLGGVGRPFLSKGMFASLDGLDSRTHPSSAQQTTTCPSSYPPTS